MPHTLTKPSLYAIRARYIQKKLRSRPEGGDVRVRVVATGKTHSGKSTLGNQLVGVDHFLKSDGHQDCTNRASIVRFPSGFEYVDLPGVSSEEEFENYNRIALGLEQIADWPHAEALPVAVYAEDEVSEEREIPVGKIPPGLLRPDLIFYLVAPHQQLLKTDVQYMKDLLRLYGGKKIIFVFNLFADKLSGETVFATPQHLEDARSNISTAYRLAVPGIQAEPNIVQINCWTGKGMAELLSAAHRALGEPRGRFFEEVIRYQQEQTPRRFLAEVKKELARFLAAVALARPVAASKKEDILFDSVETLNDFLRDVLGVELRITDEHRAGVKALADKVTESCTKYVPGAPIIKHRTRKIYDEVPVYKTVKETDYDDPQYEWETYWDRPRDVVEVAKSLRNIIDRGSLQVRRRRLKLVGYGTKKRRVLSNYERRYSHTEHWDEDTGKRERGHTLYECFGLKGVAVLAAHIQRLTSGLLHGDDNLVSVNAGYEQLLKQLKEPLRGIHKLDSGEAEKLLGTNQSLLLNSTFDRLVRKAAGL